MEGEDEVESLTSEEEEHAVIQQTICMRSSAAAQRETSSDLPSISKLRPPALLRSTPTAVFVAGPGNREDDPPEDENVVATAAAGGSSNSFDSSRIEAQVSSGVPLVAEVVSEEASGTTMTETERRNIIENAQLQVWEQIEQQTTRVHVVEEPAGKPPNRGVSMRMLLLIFAIVGAAVALGVSFSQRRNSQRETARPPPPEIVAFLRNISYEESISFPIPLKNPTPAESAVNWIFNATRMDSLDFSTKSKERTSVVQKLCSHPSISSPECFHWKMTLGGRRVASNANGNTSITTMRFIFSVR